MKIPYARLLGEVLDEMILQNAKWGEQNHPDGTGSKDDKDLAVIAKAKCQGNDPSSDNWRDILNEEVTEAFAESNPQRLREELLQIAAVAVQWVGTIDRKGTS